MREINFETSVTVRLIEGVRLIQVSLYLTPGWIGIYKFCFLRRGKARVPGKNLSEQRREPTTNSTHIIMASMYIGGRSLLLPLSTSVTSCTKIQIMHFRSSEGNRGLKYGSCLWYGVDIFWNHPKTQRLKRTQRSQRVKKELKDKAFKF